MNGSAAQLRGQRLVTGLQVPLLSVQSQRGICIRAEHARAPKNVPLQTAFTLMPNRLHNSNADIFLANITHMVLPLGIKSLQHLFCWSAFDVLPVVRRTLLCRSQFMPHSALMQAMFCPNVCIILP